MELKIVDNLEDMKLDPIDPIRMVKIDKHLSKELHTKLIGFLKESVDVFAWTHVYMV